MIELRPIKSEDIAEIKKWPPYADGFEQMDYALREGGWLDEFRDKPDTCIYAVMVDGRLSGFSLLSPDSAQEAEFRIAVHPSRTGKGLGKEITLATLEKGYLELDFSRIHLIVRKNNPRASKLYRSIGFTPTGESIHTIGGKEIEFIDMVMTKKQFDNLERKENKQ